MNDQNITFIDKLFIHLILNLITGKDIIGTMNDPKLSKVTLII